MRTSTPSSRTAPEQATPPTPEVIEPAPTRESTAIAPAAGDTIRQTVDLRRSDYRALQRHARDIADAHGLTGRELNAQKLIRAVVARMLEEDDHALLTAVADDVRRSVGK